VTRNLPWGGLVDRLRRFCLHLPRYPNYAALTCTPAGLSPAQHASLHWTHNHTVRLPRRTSAASYSGQFVTRCRCRGMWCRPAALALNGTADIRSQGTGDSLLPHLPAGSNQPIRETKSIIVALSLPGFLPRAHDDLPIRTGAALSTGITLLPKSSSAMRRTSRHHPAFHPGS
jgi:hypothetical protein